MRDNHRPPTRSNSANAASGSDNAQGHHRRRVLILPAWYPWPDRPGFGSFCRDHAHAVSLLHDVIVVTWRRDASVPRPFVISRSVEDGLRTFRIQVRPASHPRLETLITMLAVLSVVARLMFRGWRAHVVHAHEFQIGVPGIMIAVVSRAPLIISEHWSALALGQLPQEELDRARRVFRQAAVVSPVSHDLGRRLEALTEQTKITPVPNAVDTELFAPGPRPPRAEARLLTVGNLVAIKGHRTLIDAFRMIVTGDTPVTLDVVGDGELRPELEAQVREQGIESAVRFHGRLERSDVARLMREADVFVLPSLWENLPCVLLEAMSAGLPVVATRVGGTAEIVDESNGQLVEAGSAEALADGVRRVLESAYDRDRMHRTATRRYGYEAVARAWTDVYERATVAYETPAEARLSRGFWEYSARRRSS
jgi:glycosyltransferase involved in cell wall biosynthesis